MGTVITLEGPDAITNSGAAGGWYASKDGGVAIQHRRYRQNRPDLSTVANKPDDSVSLPPPLPPPSSLDRLMLNDTHRK